MLRVEADRSCSGHLAFQECTRLRGDTVTHVFGSGGLYEADTSPTWLVATRYVGCPFQAVGGVGRVGDYALGKRTIQELAPDRSGSDKAHPSRSSCANGSARATRATLRKRTSRRDSSAGLLAISGYGSTRRGAACRRGTSGLNGAPGRRSAGCNGSTHCIGSSGTRDPDCAAGAGTTRAHGETASGAAIKGDRTIGTPNYQNQKRDHSTHPLKLPPSGVRHNE